MRRFCSCCSAALLLAMAGCAILPAPNDPARKQQSVSLVNRLSWTNPLSARPDGLRSAWPLASLQGHTENFPLAQLKQCDREGGACSWGVMKVSRTIGKVGYVPSGATLELALTFEVDRHLQAAPGEADNAMTIPSDVAALHASRTVRRTLTLEYGKVQHIDLDFGVGFDLCAERLNQARQPIDQCPIRFD
jgi:hypothetical protein